MVRAIRSVFDPRSVCAVARFGMPRLVVCALTLLVITGMFWSSAAHAQSQLTLRKVWVNPIRNNAVTLSITGGSSPVAGSAVAGASTQTNATANVASGATATLTETFTTGSAASYTIAIACTRNDNGTTVTATGTGRIRQITMPNAGVTCVFTNSRPFPAPGLPPTWSTPLTCPASDSMSNNQRWEIGWLHNAPEGTINQDVFGTDFPSSNPPAPGNPLSPGPGISYGLPSGYSVAEVTMVDTPSAAQAFTAGDYVDYYMKTGPSPGKRAFLRFSFGVHDTNFSYFYPYKFAIMISPNSSFSQARMLIVDRQVPLPTSSYQFYSTNVGTSDRIMLQPNTEYYIRVLLYGSTSPRTYFAGWDDFEIMTADCPTAPDPVVLNMAKSSAVISDPVNGATNPKAIPGSMVDYTIAFSNTGGASDSNTLTFTDLLPSHLSMFVGDLGAAGSGPIAYTNGTASCGLIYSFSSLASTADSIEFTRNAGSTWDYTPVPPNDPIVNGLRIKFTGALASGAGATTPCRIRFRAQTK